MGSNTYIDIISIVRDQVAVLIGWKWVIAALEGDGPVHKEKVEVFKTQVVQCFLEGFSNIVGVVSVVPQLASNEKLAPWHTALLDGFSHSWLSAVAGRV